MPITLNDEIRRLLDGRHFAVLATINPDGGPQTSAMWVGRAIPTRTRGRRAAHHPHDGGQGDRLRRVTNARRRGRCRRELAHPRRHPLSQNAPREAGMVMTVAFELNVQRFIGMRKLDIAALRSAADGVTAS